MPTLFFADLDTLRRALASGVVPPAVSRSPALAGLDAQGRLWLQPEAPLPREALAALARFGVQVQGPRTAPAGETVACWHRLLPLQKVPLPPADAPLPPVLFELPADQLSRLAGEVRRLGGQRVHFRWLDDSDQRDADRVLVRVAAPPYGTLSRALDPVADSGPGVRAYFEQTPGVWVEVGYRHPLAEQVQPPEGQVVLLRSPSAWSLIDAGPFGAELDDFPLAAGPTDQRRDGDCPERLRLTPRLVPDPSDRAAELWVLNDRPRERLRDWAAEVDDRLTARFLVAEGVSAGRPVLVLRARPSRVGPPPLVLPGAEGYRSYLRMTNLFVPVGRRLRPVLRRDVARELLVRGETVTWLRAEGAGGFTPERLPVDAFRPLAEWVRYHPPADPRVLVGWSPDLGLDPEPFAVRDDLPRRAAPAGAAADGGTGPGAEAEPWWVRLAGGMRKLLQRSPRPAVAESAPTRPTEPAPVLPPVPVRPAAPPTEPVPRGEWDQRREALEHRFREAVEPLTPAQRQGLWPELGDVYGKLNQHADAAVCWVNALWESDAPPPAWAEAWLRAEAHGPTARPGDDQWPDVRTPAGVRGLAAYVVWGSMQDPPPAPLTANLGRCQRLFDECEGQLSVKAAWLARSALAKLAGGDALGLARARDRLLDRLRHTGLSFDRDLPGFLRFTGAEAGAHAREVGDWLGRLREPIQRWIGKLGRPAEAAPASQTTLQQKGLEPETRCTRHYADLIVAWGLARLGEAESARRLLGEAGEALAGQDEVHRLLLAGFRHRIGQAVEGQPAHGPLPADVLAGLDRLGPLERYCVDRLRERSRVLEPGDWVDAFRGSVLTRVTGFDELSRKLVKLPDLPDPTRLAQELRFLWRKEQRGVGMPAVVRTALEVAPRLGEGFAREALALLPRALDAAGRAGELGRETEYALIERGVFAAAHFDQAVPLRDLAHRLARLLASRPVDARLEGLAGDCLRALRRVGLRYDLDRLVTRLKAWALEGRDPAELRAKNPEKWPSALRALLHVAAGWFLFGREGQATAVLDAARQQLVAGDPPLPPPEQTRLAKAYAVTLGQAPVRLALGRLEELFLCLKGVQVAGSTNSHYTIAPLELVEAVVRAVVHDDFLLGPAVRRWRDDEEFVVRQRIRRDLAALVERREGGG
jgi:hypothetical protein